MPTSHYAQIPDVIQALIDANPTSILEIGVGCGKWGILAREYLQVWDHYLEPWGSRPLTIVGIEVHERYSDSPGWAAYDVVHIGDARAMAHFAGTFDCVLMVDVLEHFTKEEGRVLLTYLLETSGCMIVAIPTQFMKTIEVWSNPHEIHQCAWTVEEFTTLGDVTLYRDADSLVVTLRRNGA